MKTSGTGVFNENYRAELVAIHASLTHAHTSLPTLPARALHLYTDSLSSIQAIRRALYSPQSSVRKLHTGLVTEIAELILLRARNNLHTHIHKVKSHVGIEGNELADKHAKKAAELAVTAHNFGYWNYEGRQETISHYWAYTMDVSSPNADPSSPEPPGPLSYATCATLTTT